MRKSISSLLFLALLPGLSLADVTHEEETTMGGLMNVMGLGKPTKSTTRVSGNFMRTDNESDVTIIDLEAGRILNLDTEKKTYSVMTFEEMARKMDETMAIVGQKKGAAGREAADVSASTDVRVTETGRTETIQGIQCRQYLLELDVKLTSEKDQGSGTMSTVTEMWLAPDVPGAEELSAFQRKLAEKLGSTALAGQFLSGAGGPNPAMGADMQKMAGEMRKMEGHAMRSVMYLGSSEAAKQEALGQKPASPEGGGIAGLGELLKRMQSGEAAPSEGAEGGAMPGGVVMKITTETTRIDKKPIDPKLFSVPGDYRLVEP